MSHNVWWVEFLGAERTHKALFLQRETDTEETLYSVQGSILRGMNYQLKPFYDPKRSLAFVSMDKIGTVALANVSKIDEVCQSFPPPWAQMTLGSKSIDSGVPLYRCIEWTMDVRSAHLSRGDIRLDTTSQQYYQYKLATGETTWIGEYRDQTGQVMYLNQYDGSKSSQKSTGKHETFHKLKLVSDRFCIQSYIVLSINKEPEVNYKEEEPENTASPGYL